jgi:hypothetical protein
VLVLIGTPLLCWLISGSEELRKKKGMVVYSVTMCEHTVVRTGGVGSRCIVTDQD